MTQFIRRRWPLLILALMAAVSAALGVGIVIASGDAIEFQAGQARGLHAPDFTLLFAAPPVVIAHVMMAVAALALGPVMLLSRKGATFHRRAGWTWAGLMAGAAGSSFFLTDRTGGYSYIHVMSAMTLLLLPVALHSARRHAVARHRALMLWLFWVMLIGAAAFTLVPGRLIWRILFA